MINFLKPEKVVISAALPLEAVVIGFNYETHNTPPTYQISTKSSARVAELLTIQQFFPARFTRGWEGANEPHLLKED